jgi:ABC-type anion transport system duplicated permease subunit
MGSSNTKQEEKEVIITQNAAGSNAAKADQTDQTDHMRINNWLLGVIIAAMGIAVIIYLLKRYREQHKKWIRQQVKAEVLEGLQRRLSWKRRVDSPNEEQGQ